MHEEQLSEKRASSSINIREIQDGLTIETDKGVDTLRYYKLGSGLLWGCVIVWVVVDAIFFGNVQTWMKEFNDWLRDNPWIGSLAYIAFYAALCVAMVPGSLLTLGAGFAYGKSFGLGIGVPFAVVVVFVGAYIGMILGFWNSRFLFYSWVRAQTDKYAITKALRLAIGEDGLKVCLLIRLSPIMPFNVMNYVFGVTELSNYQYLIGNLGILPGTISYVYLGAVLGTTVDSSNPVLLTFLIIGAVLTLVLVIFLSWKAKKKLNQLLGQDDRIRKVSTQDGTGTWEDVHDEPESTSVEVGKRVVNSDQESPKSSLIDSAVN